MRRVKYLDIRHNQSEVRDKYMITAVTPTQGRTQTNAEGWGKGISDFATFEHFYFFRYEDLREGDKSYSPYIELQRVVRV